jgi:hypothetical protein
MQLVANRLAQVTGENQEYNDPQRARNRTDSIKRMSLSPFSAADDFESIQLNRRSDPPLESASIPDREGEGL